MNILIPMAGQGSRFSKVGYKLPKPLIDVCGKPMIQRVIDSLSDNKTDINFIFVAQKEHLDLGLREYLGEKGKIITIDTMTEGAACTVLLAEEIINTDEELIIANCDQFLQWDMNSFITYSEQFDGCLATFNSTNPHHSYAKVKDGLVKEVAEKIVISDKASAGIYYFKKGSDYVSGAKQMIDKNIRTNDEFYICPVYNELIEENKKISIYTIDVDKKHMLGTPEELQIFLDKVENEEVKI
jgi:NDP-sugar pyrophosphorylase family protein